MKNIFIRGEEDRFCFFGGLFRGITFEQGFEHESSTFVERKVNISVEIEDEQAFAEWLSDDIGFELHGINNP